ncbi:MFS transporter [Compostimonas suwonensis]|uniref:MFS transporter n=1 Tax=Compostimonas suwonensis TaxID=1048394 RepID=UPI0012FE479D|nr:MFS transporter [Compostimonas suwonensis]
MAVRPAPLFAVAVLVGGPLAAVIAGERSSRDRPRERFSASMLLSNFSFPRKQSRDFHFALSGKLLFVVGYYSVTGYQLYILTDYMKLDLAEAGALIGTIGLGTSLVFGFLAGPISDRIGRRKVLVIGSAILVAVATLLPFVFPYPWAMLLFALLGGIGNGVYNSVDQALNTEVLPSPDTAAKDLGILNLANTGGQIIGPGVTSGIVGLTGGYGVVFVAAAGVLVVAAFLIAPIRSVR